ncbi:MAG: glycerophosphodiester phosphodiesterase [bacterium]
MIKTFLLLIIVVVVCLSCEPDYSITDPQFNEASILNNTQPIPAEIKNRIEGVYRVVKGSGQFGDVVVAKWHNETLSVFGRNKGNCFILNSGMRDSVILFEGKWRHAVNTETGLTRLAISKRSGIDSLLHGGDEGLVFSIFGTFGEGSEFRSTELQFVYVRPFSESVKNDDFYILAHRGGGRNSDFLGASENSLEIISHVENFGANGIEIDVMLSKDNVPFLYHDSNINLREVQECYLMGPVEDYTIAQLKSFVKLKFGEEIPTLREALEFVLNGTGLKFVWLDMKSEKNSMPYVIEIQRDILNRAQLMGRNLQIDVGLPTEFMLNNLLAYPDYQSVPSLCELSLKEFNSAKSQVWAPRWTLGTYPDEVNTIHREGKKAFVWTLDQAQFIQQFIFESEFDGILTNYPTIVASFYYAKE